MPITLAVFLCEHRSAHKLRMLSAGTRHGSESLEANELCLTLRLPARATITSGRLTDLYRLALAVKHSGHLVTLDMHISQTAVVGATTAHLVVL